MTLKRQANTLFNAIYWSVRTEFALKRGGWFVLRDAPRWFVNDSTDPSRPPHLQRAAHEEIAARDNKISRSFSHPGVSTWHKIPKPPQPSDVFGPAPFDGSWVLVKSERGIDRCHWVPMAHDPSWRGFAFLMEDGEQILEYCDPVEWAPEPAGNTLLDQP